MRRIEEEARRLAVIRELAKSIGISHAKYEEKLETSSKASKLGGIAVGYICDVAWPIIELHVYFVSSWTNGRLPGGLCDVERTLIRGCFGQRKWVKGERAEHATPGTLSTIVDHTLSSRMNQQAFFTREVQPHKHPKDGHSEQLNAGIQLTLVRRSDLRRDVKKRAVVKDDQELFMTLFKYEELSIVWRLMERIFNMLDQVA
ncbi:hypothetical protein Tco_0250900 [Tanacetum coccineum]